MGQKLSWLKSAGEFYNSKEYNNAISATSGERLPQGDLFTFLKNKGVDKNQVVKWNVNRSTNPEVLTIFTKEEDFSQVSVSVSGTLWGDRLVQVLKISDDLAPLLKDKGVDPYQIIRWTLGEGVVTVYTGRGDFEQASAVLQGVTWNGRSVQVVKIEK